MDKIPFISKTLALALALGLASCSPSAYSLLVERRQPSPAGIELGGKSMSVVFLESEDGRDSTFNSAMSNAFVGHLEENYFDGAQGIDLYRITKDGQGDYSSRDTLASLVMSTGSDVVFLVDTPQVLGEAQGVLMKVFVYDSRSRTTDSVYASQGSVRTVSLTDRASATAIGKAMADHYVGKWKEESFPVVYFDVEDKWIEAVLCAIEMDWEGASDIWLQCLSSGSMVKRSCAEYNLALACYISGEPALALEWLDRSDADYVISPSASLRTRIRQEAGE